MRYIPLNDSVPVENAKRLQCSSALTEWKDKVSKLEKDSPAVYYTYMYAHEDVFRSDFFIAPSQSAHTGLLLVVNRPPLVVEGEKAYQSVASDDYLKRGLMANAYKNQYLYRRRLFRKVDPYMVTTKFIVTGSRQMTYAEEELWEPMMFEKKEGDVSEGLSVSHDSLLALQAEALAGERRDSIGEKGTKRTAHIS